MNDLGLKDIKGPIELPGDWWWLWLLAAAIAAGLIFLFVRFLSVYLKRRKDIPVLPIPPWERALASLEALERSPVEGAEAVKHFYFILSGIIRLYIEERFDIRAPEMTTEEFMERARRSPDISSEQHVFLNDFLNVSDMVKFARFETTMKDRANALALARGFVTGTRPLTQEKIA